MKNTIDVVLTLASPLFVAYPDNYSEGLSRTITKPVNVGGRKHEVPYYPANGFRGAFRRAIADRICDHLKATESAVPGDLYNGLHCGASSGSPDQSALTIEEIVRARKHVYMGLFGGGARTHESMYAVSDMNPIIDATVAAGCVPERYREEYVVPHTSKDGAVSFLQPYQIIGERHFLRVDDLYRVMNPDLIQRTVANPIETVAAHQAAVGVNKEDRKGGAVKEDVANLQSFQTVAEGTPMHFRVDLKADATEGQIGAMLLALEAVFIENYFGGAGRQGMGRVKVAEIVFDIGGAKFAWGGNSLYKDGEFQLPDEAARFVDVAKAEIEAIRMADIAPFFEDFSAGKKADAKAKKAAKTAA